MNLEELQNQIITDTRRLGELQAKEKESAEVVYNDGGEVKYRTIKTQNQTEIEQLRFKIMNMQAEVERIKSYKEQKSTKPTEVSKEEIEKQQEQKKQEEDYKKATFKRIQQLYKSQSAFSRFKNLINNNKPNWKNIKGYSQEELDFLVNMGMGKTATQENRQENIQQKYDGKLKQTEINKKINEKNNLIFDNALANQEELNKYLEVDQQAERHR